MRAAAKVLDDGGQDVFVLARSDAGRDVADRGKVGGILERIEQGVLSYRVRAATGRERWAAG